MAILSHRNTHIVSLLLIGLIIFCIYLPGINGPFVFDDTVHLVKNDFIKIRSIADFGDIGAAIDHANTGFFKRPLAVVSFAINYYLSPNHVDTFPFKLTNILIHIINTFLVYWLCHLLLRKYRLSRKLEGDNFLKLAPILIALFWTIHPIQLTSVLYVVQRMTSLSALFVLSGLIAFLYGRLKVNEIPIHGYTLMVSGLITGLVFGIGCKENAVLILVYALLIEIIFFNRGSLKTFLNNKKELLLFYSVMVALPVLLVCIWLLLNPGFILDSYQNRPFTLYQRLLTEARVLWLYLGQIFFPCLKGFGLFHDDILLSKGLFTPWSTFVSLTFWLGIFTASILAMRKYSLFAFGVLWFLIGHSIESSFLSLEVAHEHRNYLPYIGVIFIALNFFYLIKHKFQTNWLPIAGITAVTIILCSITIARSNIWSSESNLIRAMARNHPHSARSQNMLAELYLNGNNPRQTMKQYLVALNLAPYEVSYLMKFTFAATHLSMHNLKIPTSFDESDYLTVNGSRILFSNIILIKRLPNKRSLYINPYIQGLLVRKLLSTIITADTLSTIDYLYDCHLKKTAICTSLYTDHMVWFDAIQMNPRLHDSFRADLYGKMAHIRLSYYDGKSAINSAKKGLEISPNNAILKLIEADAHILDRKYSKARLILNNLFENETISKKLRMQVKSRLGSLNNPDKRR